MNKFGKLLVAASAVIACYAQAADADIMAKTPVSAYLQDGRGVIARSNFGLCWRTGYWTPADAVPGCDGPIAKAPEKAAPAAPAPEPVKVAPPPPPAPPAPPPTPSAEKVSFAADALFDFNKSVLKPEGIAKLNDLTSKLQGMNLEVIIAVGHTDSIGSDAYNQALSLKRAAAVKAHLVGKGVEASRVYTEGKGEKSPVADNKTEAGRAANRRVEIEVVGTRNK